MLELSEISGQEITSTKLMMTDLSECERSCGAKCSLGNSYISHLLSSDAEIIAVFGTKTDTEVRTAEFS